MPKFLIAKWSMTRAKEADKKETTYTVVAYYSAAHKMATAQA